MREIKFRAWDGRKMHHNVSALYPLLKKDGKYPCRVDDMVTDQHMPYAEIMQFTGLHDKDGREIYEGDAVRYTNPYSKQTYQHTVLWDNRFAGFALFENGNQWAKESDWLKIEDIEIVGNIHEHPELLNN
jgi:uncharacterized phage protein (TIGR01671 family)